MVKPKRLPTSIIQSKTAIPTFIGYTEKHSIGSTSLRYKLILISSLIEYEEKYGHPCSSKLTVNLNDDNTLKEAVNVTQPTFLLYYGIRLYFENGGGPCYIVAAGTYQTAGKTGATKLSQMQRALAAVAAGDEPTLLVLPDAALLSGNAYYKLLKASLQQCAILRDRFALLDVFHPINMTTADTHQYITEFRKGIGMHHLNYGAAYYPWLKTELEPFVNQKNPSVLVLIGDTGLPSNLILRNDEGDGSNSLFHINQMSYYAVMEAVAKSRVVLPPSAAVAAVCVQIDQQFGVWKAPANVPLKKVQEPAVPINNAEQDNLNVDFEEGKSINSICSFAGRGILIWGARTLAGNDNEWRYISVRRFFSMVEESVRKGIAPFVYEPNETATWATVKALIENFLITLWRSGAMQGAKPEHAFFVKVGLGQTMTIQDIEEGRMILEIGVAIVRPAEFIILRITHQMVMP